MPVIRAFRKQLTGGRPSPEPPEPRATACAITLGLDALTACHMGVMTPLNAASPPPGSKAAHRHALRATNPFKTLRLAYFSSQARKNRNAALKGLVAPNRHIPRWGGKYSLAATVCGASPPQKTARGRAFLLAGAAKFLRLPPPACSIRCGRMFAGGRGS